MMLQAASARRHDRVPEEHEREIVWVIAERPTDGYFRCVIDVKGDVCWPSWRKVYQDTVELMSPVQYPPREFNPEDAVRHCAHCGRVFGRHHGSAQRQHEARCLQQQDARRRIAARGDQVRDGVLGYTRNYCHELTREQRRKKEA